MSAPLPGRAREGPAEQGYADAERSLEAYYATRRRRGPLLLIGTLAVLVLAVSVVVAVDLRRLQTPRGTALNWTGSTVFGECRGYQRLSVPDPDAVRPERRTDAALCRDLRAQTEPARQSATQIGIDVLAVTEQGREATVTVEVRRPEGTERVELPLVRRGGGWAVVRTAEVCLAVGCA